MGVKHTEASNRIVKLCRVATFLLAVLLFATTESASAQLAESDRGDAAGRSAIWADNLAKGRYADRQRATLDMWRLRQSSRQAVQDAARDTDPEVAQRAAWILKQWRSGALPGVSKTDPKLLLDRGTPTALAMVLEQGAFDAVLVAVEESAGTMEFDQIKRRVARSLIERYPMYTDMAFADGTESDLLMLLDAVSVDRNLATATRDLMRYLEIKIDDSNRLPSAASLWSRTDREICLSQFAMLRGDVDQSIEHARMAGDPVLLRIAQMLGNRWDEITDDAFLKSKTAKSLEDRIEAFTWGLAGASRIRDEARIQQARTQLIELPGAWGDVSTGDPERGADLCWRVLALHDDVPDAIDVLASIDKTRASKLASLTSRFERAEDLSGFELENVATELDEWIDNAYAEQAALRPMTLAPSIERLYALARLLLSLGDSDNAERIYRRLTSHTIIISDFGVSLREQTLNELDLVNRLDWMRDLAVAPGEKVVRPRARRIVAYALKTEDSAFEDVLERVSVLLPKNGSFRQRFQMTFQLFRGELPDEFDASNDFRRLFDALIHHPQIRRIGGRVRKTEKVSMDLEIVEMFLRHGQVELAREGLDILADQGNVDAMISIAEMELKQGGSRSAAEKWRRAADQASNFTATEAIITLDHGLAYAKAVTGQWILAKRAGHAKIADQLEQRLRFMLTSPSLTFREGLADYLQEMQQFELAANALRDLTVLASFGGDDAPDFFQIAIAYVGVIDDIKDSNPSAFAALKMDPEDAVKWSDLAVLGILKNTLYHDKAFVSVPLSVRKTLLQHAIESKNAELAQRSVRQIESYDPLNIDFGERLLPELRESGQEQLADAAFDRLMDRGTTHVKRFGTDATALNNLAWTAAMNERRLDQALQLSKTAVMLEPDSVVFRDTLAEVLHLLGRTDQALAIESACLLDESDEWHIHEQVAKYRKLLGR